jgi:tetratricopeptide (TPR) repeat protein
VAAIAGMGAYFRRNYTRGKREYIAVLNAHEENALHALRLAREQGMWDSCISILYTLNATYQDAGRGLEFSRRLKETLPDFVDLTTDDALPGREQYWKDITLMRARDARDAMDLPTAERLYARLIQHCREKAAPALADPSAPVDEPLRAALDTLGTVLQSFGVLQWSQGKPECVQSLEEALAIAERIDDLEGSSACVFHLGHAYLDFPSIRDLAKAEYWYRRKLDIETRRGDPMGRAFALHELGQISYFRFRSVLDRPGGQEEAHRLINQAVEFANAALETAPPEARVVQNHVHHLLGNIYDDAGRFDLALPHYVKSAQLCELSGDRLGAAKLRREIARGYYKLGRVEDAHEYALAALRDVQGFGGAAAADLAQSEGLLREIERVIATRKR